MRLSLWTTVLWAAIVVMPSVADAATVADFIEFSLRDANNQVLLPGRLYVPPESLGPLATPRPLLTFLHGGGANGSDNLAQIRQVSEGMFNAARERGAFLYVPQTPSGWSSTTITSRMMTMIDRAVAERNADNDRLFMTGFSNGGGGTWNMLSRYDGRFAAAIAVSGVSPGAGFVAGRLIDTPIVALHARDDATVSVNISRNVMNGILTAAHETLPSYLPASNPSTFFLSNANLDSHTLLRTLVHQMGDTTDFLVSNPSLDLLYFESAGGGHSGLLGALGAPELYDWLFAHSTAVPEPNRSAMLAPIILALVARRCRCFAGRQSGMM